MTNIQFIVRLTSVTLLYGISACSKEAATTPATSPATTSATAATDKVSTASVEVPSSLAATMASASLDTPESAVYEVLAAIFAKDQNRINRATVEAPDRDILAQGQDMSAIAIALAMARIRAVPFVHLKVGDVITLPGNKMLEITADRVNENQQYLTNADTPVPFIVIKVGDQWKVDAGPLIAARKAAAAARARAATRSATKP